MQGPKYIGNCSTTGIVGWNKHVYNYYSLLFRDSKV
jgi:hypothetical protein